MVKLVLLYTSFSLKATEPIDALSEDSEYTGIVGVMLMFVRWTLRRQLLVFPTVRIRYWYNF